jgi:GDP/UDP-N,N'-diacetylbacillosamine 2-epimerase (hydrolysing)
MKKICIVTGTRAEYGLLRPLIEKINNDEEMELQLIATGTHLSSEFGMTYKEIEEDGFYITQKVETLLSSDSFVGISKSMGLGMISFSECFARLQPDLVLVLGDRYEIFSLAAAAYVARIPIAHLHGGETTEGAFDEAFRHSITKMSYLHFTSAEEYKNRVIQLGEDPSRVFNVGAIGIENIKTMNLLTKEELENSINFKFGEKTVLVTYHPVTLENNTSESQFADVLDALNQLKDLKIIFTKTNSDTDGRIINNMIDDYVIKNSERAISFTSMGSKRYLSAMKYVDAVIGNSSSGIIEAPYFKVPTVNIGDRQKGRMQAESIIHCKNEKEDIVIGIQKGISAEFKSRLKEMESPYGNGDVSHKIIYFIKEEFKKGINLKKNFYNL